jgi:AbrB family looped-hinge helix DNA binding protein
MEQVTVSSKGQIAIPRQVREALSLIAGSRLSLEVRGQEIVLSKGDRWKALEGAGGDMMKKFAAFKAEEREREDSRP